MKKILFAVAVLSLSGCSATSRALKWGDDFNGKIIDSVDPLRMSEQKLIEHPTGKINPREGSAYVKNS